MFCLRDDDSQFEGENTMGIAFIFVLIFHVVFLRRARVCHNSLKTSGIIATIDSSMRRHVRNPRRNSVRGGKWQWHLSPPLSPYHLMTLNSCYVRHLPAKHDVRATRSSQCIEETSRRFVPRLRMSSNARGISMCVRAHARTRSRFANVEICIVSFLLGANLHFRWTRQRLLLTMITRQINENLHFIIVCIPYPVLLREKRWRMIFLSRRNSSKRSNGKLSLWE